MITHPPSSLVLALVLDKLSAANSIFIPSLALQSTALELQGVVKQSHPVAS